MHQTVQWLMSKLLLPIYMYMMKVATYLVIVALLTAAVTAARMKRRQEGSNSEESSCIETFIDLEKSLVKRNSNINRLHNAFFPSNQQVPVAVDLLVHFSTSLQTTSHKLCNPSTARLDNHTADYKFRWSASAACLFVQPEILRPLSVFVYRGTVTTAEVVIDPMCADLNSEVQQMERKVCKESTNEEKPEHLLNKLCIHLKSYHHHRAAEENRALTGYCLYYFNHTDPHLLDSSTEDTLQQIFLIIAITFLWVIIAISVPAALYTKIVVEIITKTSPTTNSRERFEQSEAIIRAVIETLYKIRNKYSIIAAFIVASFLDIILIVLNVWLLVNSKFNWFILCFDIAFIALSIVDVICILVVARIKKKRLDTQRDHILYAAGVISLVMALQLLAFHFMFILLVFIFSPIPTACFTLIYISALFSLLTLVRIMIKAFHKCYRRNIGDKKCDYVFQITVAILFTIFVVFLDALFFTTLVRARLDYLGVSGFFGALVPTAIITLISFIGNKLIKDDDTESNNGNSRTGDRNRPTG